jgi:hypothetical protein
MSSTSDSRVDTTDRDPNDHHDAEPARSDPWASGPGHLSHDEQETERFVPEPRDGGHDSEHDGHLYASDTYAEPETEVIADERATDTSASTEVNADEPTAVGVAHVDTDHTTDDTDHSAADDAEAKADAAAEEAEEAKVHADEAREDAEEAKADHSFDTTEFEEARTDDDEPDSRPEPVVETVPLPAAEPVAVLEPVGEPVGDRRVDGEEIAVVPVVAEPFGTPVVAEPVAAGSDDVEESAAEPAGDLKPGDVPVAPVAGFLTADAAQGLRDRWREAQLGFVDDPRQAVDDVRALVSEAVDQFTSALSAQRDELDAAAGEDTEQYRVAVQRYRAFFDRLLDL